VPPQKIVLGVPFYGYIYNCLNGPIESTDSNSTCVIPPVPFRGAPCSDAAGSEHDYRELRLLLAHNATVPRQWDTASQTPWFEFTHDVPTDISTTGTSAPVDSSQSSSSTQPQVRRRAQVWYDDPESLALKYLMAKRLRLQGVGMWHIDALDYGNDQQARLQTAEMWQTMKIFL